MDIATYDEPDVTYQLEQTKHRSAPQTFDELQDLFAIQFPIPEVFQVSNTKDKFV